MGNLLELGTVLLLCIQTALALRCKECSSFLNKKCKHEIKTCIAEEEESCMITRIWALPNTVNDPTDGYSGCWKNCKGSDYEYGDQSVLTSCCDAYDFCNDIRVPIDEWY